jgi:hypothetical protein
VIAEAPASVSLTPIREPPNYSLVLGGPLFKLYRRTHLSGDALELPWRRIAAISLAAWLPLMVLSLLEGSALNGNVKVPFLYDFEAYARFLIALPLLIAAEFFVHSHITPLARWFSERRIVLPEDLPEFNAAISSALRVRNSVVVEATLLIMVYTLGLWLWRSRIPLGAATWYAIPEGAHSHLTLAGYWYAFVSIPMFQFLLVRWYLRLGIWFRLLWRLSRLSLHLIATHPDRAGGIGFLGKQSYAFAPILFAQGALLAGMMANRILYDGQELLSFKMEAVGLVVWAVLVILGPLLMFTPQLERAKWKGAGEYGALANRYTSQFEEKWIRSSVREGKPLLGTPDLQSLADLSNSYSIVDQMRIIPFGWKELVQLAAATAAPLLPLAFTTFSVEETLKHLTKVFF